MAQSINEVGLLHPIVIDSQKNLIAGARRIKAVQTLGWTRIPVHIVDLKDLGKGEFHENVARKGFTPSEMVAVKRALEPEIKADAEERMKAGQPSANLAQGETRDIVSSFAGVSHGTLAQAETVVEAAEHEPEKYGTLLEKVDSGEVSVSSAERQIKREKMLTELREKQKNVQPVNGNFDIIVIDPPWPSGFDYDPEHWRGACPYPEMSLEDIKAIKLPMTENCVVWLWTTNAFLHEAFHVLEAWELTPKSVLTWAKDKFGLGVWLRGQTEHCILAVRGSPKINLTHQTTLLNGIARNHSRKPDEFFTLIDSLCFGSKVEYFAREKREGWSVYGTLEHS